MILQTTFQSINGSLFEYLKTRVIQSNICVPARDIWQLCTQFSSLQFVDQISRSGLKYGTSCKGTSYLLQNLSCSNRFSIVNIGLFFIISNTILDAFYFRFFTVQLIGMVSASKQSTEFNLHMHGSCGVYYIFSPQ